MSFSNFTNEVTDGGITADMQHCIQVHFIRFPSCLTLTRAKQQLIRAGMPEGSRRADTGGPFPGGDPPSDPASGSPASFLYATSWSGGTDAQYQI